MEIALGHLEQERKNQRSTKSIIRKREKAQFVKIITPQKEGKYTQIRQENSQLHQADDTSTF